MFYYGFAEYARKIYRQFWQGFLHKVHRKKKRLEAMTKDNRGIVKLLFFMKIIMGKKRSVQADERRRKNGKSLVVPKLNHNFRSSTRDYYSKVRNKRTCSQLYKVVNKNSPNYHMKLIEVIRSYLRLFEIGFKSWISYIYIYLVL